MRIYQQSADAGQFLFGTHIAEFHKVAQDILK